MNSPDAVFGNRFIKMFYNYQGQAPIRERLGAITASANIGAGDSTVKERVSAEGSTLTKTIGKKLRTLTFKVDVILKIGFEPILKKAKIQNPIC